MKISDFYKKRGKKGKKELKIAQELAMYFESTPRALMPSIKTYKELNKTYKELKFIHNSVVVGNRAMESGVKPVIDQTTSNKIKAIPESEFKNDNSTAGAALTRINPVIQKISPKVLAWQVENPTYDDQDVSLFSNAKKLNPNVIVKNVQWSKERGEMDYEFALKQFISQPFEVLSIRVSTENFYQFEQDLIFNQDRAEGSSWCSRKTPITYFKEGQNQLHIIDIPVNFKLGFGASIDFTLKPRTTLYLYISDQGEPVHQCFDRLLAVKIQNTSSEFKKFEWDFNIVDFINPKGFKITDLREPRFPSYNAPHEKIFIHKIFTSNRKNKLLINAGSKQFCNWHKCHDEILDPGKYMYETHKIEEPCKLILDKKEKEKISMSIEPNEYVILCYKYE